MRGDDHRRTEASVDQAPGGGDTRRPNFCLSFMSAACFKLEEEALTRLAPGNRSATTKTLVRASLSSCHIAPMRQAGAMCAVRLRSGGRTLE